MKFYLIVTFFLTLQNTSAQSYFGRTVRFDTYGSLLVERRVPMWGSDQYVEYTWAKGVAVRVTRDFWWGFKHNHIWGKTTVFGASEKVDAFMLGSYVLYRPVVLPRVYVDLRLGYAYGNLCTCERTDPYVRANLHYLSFAPAIDFQLLPRLWVNLGLEFNPLLDPPDPENSYWANTGIFGINFKLGKVDR